MPVARCRRQVAPHLWMPVRGPSVPKAVPVLSRKEWHHGCDWQLGRGGRTGATPMPGASWRCSVSRSPLRAARLPTCPVHSDALLPSWPLAPLVLRSPTPHSEVSTAYPCPHQHIPSGCTARVHAFLTLRLDYITSSNPPSSSSAFPRSWSAS